MTKEEKQLLLKDLCAREPYHTRIQVYNDGYEGFQVGEFDTDLWLHHIDAFRFDRIEVLPYLRPMSSMTEEEQKELEKIIDGILGYKARNYFHSEDDYKWNTLYEAIDWLNTHNFDYRGLIGKGLAIEAPENMYK